MTAPAANPATPAVEVRNLHFHYATSDGSLHDISLTIAPGESIALIGPNGAGKSTLLQHLNGLLPESLPRTPSVHIFGLPLDARNIGRIRQRVGLVFQDADDQLFCPTIFEDVGFGPRQLGLPETEVQARVAQALARVGLPDIGPRSPHRLSGGEKRRACIAGILACQPDILALDEPSSNLDPRSRRQLINLLAAFPTTKILATHDLDMALELCPRALVMDGGKLIADGVTRQLLADPILMETHGLEVPARLQRPNP